MKTRSWILTLITLLFVAPLALQAQNGLRTLDIDPHILETRTLDASHELRTLGVRHLAVQDREGGVYAEALDPERNFVGSLEVKRDEEGALVLHYGGVEERFTVRWNEATDEYWLTEEGSGASYYTQGEAPTEDQAYFDERADLLKRIGGIYFDLRDKEVMAPAASARNPVGDFIINQCADAGQSPPCIGITKTGSGLGFGAIDACEDAKDDVSGKCSNGICFGCCSFGVCSCRGIIFGVRCTMTGRTCGNCESCV